MGWWDGVSDESCLNGVSKEKVVVIDKVVAIEIVEGGGLNLLVLRVQGCM